MRRTSASALFGLAVLGGAAGWLLQLALASSGAASYIPQPTLYGILFVIAVVVLLLAWPVRRAAHGRAERRIDPFFATRVLMLAKASSLTGALLAGAGVAFVLYAVSRTGSTATPAFLPSALTALAALALLVAGMIAESWCRVPPDDRESDRRAVRGRAPDPR